MEALENLEINNFEKQGFYKYQIETPYDIEFPLTDTQSSLTDTQSSLTEKQSSLNMQITKHLESDEWLISYVTKGNFGTVFLLETNMNDSRPVKRLIIKLIPKIVGDKLDDSQKTTQIVMEENIRELGLELTKPFILSGPNEEEDMYCFIQEYFCCEMAYLYEIIKQKGITNEKLSILYNNMLAAVYTFHEKGFIHGDIKPSNIRCDKHMRITLIDFDTICIKKVGCQTNSTYSRPYTIIKPSTQYFLKKYIAMEENDIISTVLSLVHLLLPKEFVNLQYEEEKRTVVKFFNDIEKKKFYIDNIDALINSITKVEDRYMSNTDKIVRIIKINQVSMR
jgi:hypothetical protein